MSSRRGVLVLAADELDADRQAGRPVVKGRVTHGIQR